MSIWYEMFLLQNVKAVFDAAIKVVLQPPKAKKKKGKSQRACSILWSNSRSKDIPVHSWRCNLSLLMSFSLSFFQEEVGGSCIFSLEATSVISWSVRWLDFSVLLWSLIIASQKHLLGHSILSSLFWFVLCINDSKINLGKQIFSAMLFSISYLVVAVSLFPKINLESSDLQLHFLLIANSSIQESSTFIFSIYKVVKVFMLLIEFNVWHAPIMYLYN